MAFGDRAKIVAEIIGDARKFNRTVDGAARKAGSLNRGLKFAGGVAAFAGLTLGATALAGALGDAGVAFREDQLSQSLLAQALKNNIPNWDRSTAAVEEYAAAQGRLGFSDDEVRESIGQLIGITHDLTRAQELNTLAQELARAKNISLAEASDVITRALQGNSRALKAYGIDTAGAANETEILDRIYQNVKGSAEAYAATSSGKLAASQVKVGEAMEKFGAAVDQIGQVSLPVLAEGLTILARGMDRVFTAVSAVVGALNKAINAFRTFTNLESGRGGGGSFTVTAPTTTSGTTWRSPTYAKGRAIGGPVEAGRSYLVGEQGPEILQMGGRGGNIIPNRASVGGAVLVFNFNGPVYGDGPFLDELSNRIAQRLRYATGR